MACTHGFGEAEEAWFCDSVFEDEGFNELQRFAAGFVVPVHSLGTFAVEFATELVVEIQPEHAQDVVGHKASYLDVAVGVIFRQLLGQFSELVPRSRNVRFREASLGPIVCVVEDEAGHNTDGVEVEGPVKQVGSFEVDDVCFILLVVKQVGRKCFEVCEEGLGLGVVELRDIRYIAAGYAGHESRPVIIPGDDLRFKLHIWIKFLILSHVLLLEIHAGLVPIPMPDGDLGTSCESQSHNKHKNQGDCDKAFHCVNPPLVVMREIPANQETDA